MGLFRGKARANHEMEQLARDTRRMIGDISQKVEAYASCLEQAYPDPEARTIIEGITGLLAQRLRQLHASDPNQLLTIVAASIRIHIQALEGLVGWAQGYAPNSQAAHEGGRLLQDYKALGRAAYIFQCLQEQLLLDKPD